jgi:hypothetical protein
MMTVFDSLGKYAQKPLLIIFLCYPGKRAVAGMPLQTVIIVTVWSCEVNCDAWLFRN